MANIAVFPPELWSEIIPRAISVPGTLNSDPLDVFECAELEDTLHVRIAESVKTKLSLCLVCREFLRITQPYLFQIIQLRTTRQVEKLAKLLETSEAQHDSVARLTEMVDVYLTGIDGWSYSQRGQILPSQTAYALYDRLVECRKAIVKIQSICTCLEHQSFDFSRYSEAMSDARDGLDDLDLRTQFADDISRSFSISYAHSLRSLRCDLLLDIPSFAVKFQHLHTIIGPTEEMYKYQCETPSLKSAVLKQTSNTAHGIRHFYLFLRIHGHTLQSLVVERSTNSAISTIHILQRVTDHCPNVKDLIFDIRSFFSDADLDTSLIVPSVERLGLLFAPETESDGVRVSDAAEIDWNFYFGYILGAAAHGMASAFPALKTVRLLSGRLQDLLFTKYPGFLPYWAGEFRNADVRLEDAKGRLFHF